jgi:large subunit ribosomal protein L22
MRTQARVRFIRVPASKARLVLAHIRGKSVGEALAVLQFTQKAAGRLIEKVLRSAIANAEHNHQVRDLDDLRVVKAVADGGPSMKRVSPRAMGRAYFIKHRTSHLTIELSDETPGGARMPAAPQPAPARRRAAAPRPARAPRQAKG